MFQQHAKPYVKKPERFLEEAFWPRTARSTATAPSKPAGNAAHHHRGLPDPAQQAIWAHCGDSRLYWLRRGQMMARTRDHSHVET